VHGVALMTGHIVSTILLTGSLITNLTLGTITASELGVGETTVGETVKSRGNLIHFHTRNRHRGFPPEAGALSRLREYPQCSANPNCSPFPRFTPDIKRNAHNAKNSLSLFFAKSPTQGTTDRYQCQCPVKTRIKGDYFEMVRSSKGSGPVQCGAITESRG